MHVSNIPFFSDCRYIQQAHQETCSYSDQELSCIDQEQVGCALDILMLPIEREGMVIYSLMVVRACWTVTW